jgi:hypothetical protein
MHSRVLLREVVTGVSHHPARRILPLGTGAEPLTREKRKEKEETR